jgi:hypothetical protein
VTVDLKPGFADGDAFYAALVDAVEAAGPEGGMRLLARLCLILANQVGDAERLREALALAARLS